MHSIYIKALLIVGFIKENEFLVLSKYLLVEMAIPDNKDNSIVKYN